MNLKQAAKAACATLDYAAEVADRPGLMGECEKAASALRAALAEADEPVAAQHRFRHPQKTMPDWGPWQPCVIRKNRPAWEIDSQGYEVEYRVLYTHPPRREPLTDEAILDLWSWASTHEAEQTATTQQHAFARAIERAHGIGTDE